jgi:hypothetical protein
MNDYEIKKIKNIWKEQRRRYCDWTSVFETYTAGNILMYLMEHEQTTWDSYEFLRQK